MSHIGFRCVSRPASYKQGEKTAMATDSNRSNSRVNRRALLAGVSAVAASGVVRSASAQQQSGQAQPQAPAGGRPNILVIFGDDIGQS
ncbi:MAG: hypothetical protein JO143_13205, partial [Acetobacteraceae bacterium]|nr:hypothetical protein [Acetobacteraceae bacterium]